MTGAGAVGARPAAVVPQDPFELLPEGAVVAVAMSGGVDSSVAAARCVAAGVRCIGITLAMWPRDRARDRDRGCCSVDAVEDARRVAATLGIPHYVWDLERGFHDEVVADYEAEHAAGRTPNPCVRCNERVKFGLLLERAHAVGATHVATGHYARAGRRGGRPTLHRGLDRAKDQSYTLHRLGPERLLRAVLPLGGAISKADVRAEAARLGLATATKPDSQELCFVDGDRRDDLRHRLAGRYAPGPIVDTGGRRLGEHAGLPFFTVGQRTGLGLAPRSPDARPLHVLRLEPGRNRIVAGPREALVTGSARAVDCSWFDGPPATGSRCLAQLRAHGEPVGAEVTAAGADGGVEVRFEGPVSAAAPGQSLVLLDGDEVLGGGILAEPAGSS